MANRFNTSTNIIRDEKRKLDYVVTPNAEHVVEDICHAYQNGIHSFTLIGSYGTGKSSFLLAFLESLGHGSPLKVDLGFKPKKIDTLRLVGQYQSLIRHFHELFDISDDFDGNQKIFDRLFERTRNCDLLVIYLDEFGKFLEYASKNDPDKELYFLQQLAEFANDHEREILLISTLHQSFEAYASNMVQETQKREWKKVKGRFKELTFNEPVEQLLFLAAEKLGGRQGDAPQMAALAKEKHLLGMNPTLLESIDSKLAPLDVIAAGVLTRALQAYGQNERSLFTFLESDLTDDRWFHIPRVYDYLFTSFYSYLETSHNKHFRQWRAIMSGFDRIESSGMEHTSLGLDIFKTIALLQLFGHKGAHVDEETITTYFSPIADKKAIKETLETLKGRKLITFANYSNSFKVIEGTDIDFDYELNQAEESVDRGFDLPSILGEHFNFSVIQAKEISYVNGTPRLFTFHISTDVAIDLDPVGAIDGYINLVFNDNLSFKSIKEKSSNLDEAVLVAYYTNSKEIEDRVYEILKTKKVLADVDKDPVAKQEFMNILNSNERLLTHEVIGALYTEKVRWFFRGEERKGIDGQKQLNKLLSKISNICYPDTPVFRNELLNKHKISASIHTARKNYFLHLATKWNEPQLGFEPNKYPPREDHLPNADASERHAPES
jgi:DNA replication protein DnaC